MVEEGASERARARERGIERQQVTSPSSSTWKRATSPTQGPSWGYSKVNVLKTIRKRGQFSSKVDKSVQTAPRASTRYPHEGPFVGPLSWGFQSPWCLPPERGDMHSTRAGEHGTDKTVEARFWPWNSGPSPYKLSSCSLFARQRHPFS